MKKIKKSRTFKQIITTIDTNKFRYVFLENENNFEYIARWQKRVCKNNG